MGPIAGGPEVGGTTVEDGNDALEVSSDGFEDLEDLDDLDDL
jgi:hypothetical protein